VYYQSDYALGSTQSAAHNVTLALEYETTDFRQRGEVFFFGDPNQDQEIDTTSAVLEYRGRIGEAFSYSLSGRHDDHSDFDDATTGRAVAAYALSPRTRLRGSVGTARKAPTFTERFGFFADVFIGNPDLEPERSFAWDIGIEQRWLDERVRVQVSYFDQDLEDEIDGFVFDPDSGLFTAENLPGTSERDGIEVALEASFGNLELAGSYTYTTSTEDRGGATTDELRRPEHVASANINYAMLDDRLNLNLNVSYTGEQDDIFFPPFPAPSEVVTLDDFTLVDFAARYRINDRIAVFGRATNLFDESYEEILGFRTLGRAVYVGARFELGR
jgi:vitamin B12 transporter